MSAKVLPFPGQPRVDIDGNRVLIFGARAKTFMTTSNAIRSAEALRILDELGWPIGRLVEPQEIVRDMLARSVAALEPAGHDRR